MPYLGKELLFRTNESSSSSLSSTAKDYNTKKESETYMHFHQLFRERKRVRTDGPYEVIVLVLV